MTPKEKATDLITSYSDKLFERGLRINEQDCVGCALICVNEIIEAVSSFGYSGVMFDDFESGEITTTNKTNPEEYWYSVKDELNIM